MCDITNPASLEHESCKGPVLTEEYSSSMTVEFSFSVSISTLFRYEFQAEDEADWTEFQSQLGTSSSAFEHACAEL